MNSLSPKSYEEALARRTAKRSEFQQHRPMKRSGKLKPGRKVKEWAAVRAKLKLRFAAAEITTCEVQLVGCQPTFALGFAHGKKRRFLQGDELETLVCLACVSCHARLDNEMRHEEMLRVVEAIIAARKVRP